MCLGTANSSKQQQRLLGTKRNQACFFRHQCIHGLQCWGVHTSSELELFRQQEALTRSIAQCSPSGGFSAVVSVCRDALFSEARRWCDREALAASKDEFFDAELIPRRRAHRRLRKRQRAQYRKEQRQQKRRAYVIKSRWCKILVKGDIKRQQQQQQQQQQ